MRSLNRRSLTGTALLLLTPSFLFAAPQVASEAASKVASSVASQVATRVASQVASEAASQVASSVASEVASDVTSQVASSVASQVASQIADKVASEIGPKVASEIAARTALANIILREQWTGNGCPVSLSVQRTSPTEIVNADQAQQHRGSQRIHLSVDPRDTSGIRRAEITVHATSLKPRFLPANSANTSPDLDRNFQISGPSTSGLRDRDLWIDGAGSVLSVDLTCITYVDGSTWHRSSGSVCRAVPSNFLLVSSN